jgi:Putative transmembrane protein (PGPGW)
MLDALKRRYRRFMSVPSGERFCAYHRRLRQRPNLMRTLLIAGVGLLLLALGLIMLVLPGPGLLFAAAGAALLAGESLTAARLLDRIDAGVTGIWRRWRR